VEPQRGLSLPAQAEILAPEIFLPMFIDDFTWLPDIVDKLAVKHNVTRDEAEEVFFNQPRFRFVERGYRSGEDVYAAGGQTDAGRYLVVFFILKPSRKALILSARDMDKKERRRHER
jgi:uncharacterized DUF497 family protein